MPSFRLRCVTSQELGQRIFVDREAVVLRRDLDRARLQILHRMIRAAVAELELERLRAAGQAEQLMAQADAEDRLLAQQAADRVDRVFERLRIAGAVGEEHAVGLLGQHLLGRRRAGQNRHAATHGRPGAAGCSTSCRSRARRRGAGGWGLGTEGSIMLPALCSALARRDASIR